MEDQQRGSENDEFTLGLRKAGEREAHIVGEQLAGGAALSLCGKDLQLWPLAEGARVRLCQNCKTYSSASRMAASSSYA